jgi:serine/threonine protein kinase/WD40 repeat protein/tetratricopeptide (TPR) repeat protein
MKSQETLPAGQLTPEESWLRAAASAPVAQVAAEQLNPIQRQRTLASGDGGEPRYELENEVARGGLGRIMRAKDRKLQRVVAVKELISSNKKAAERFLREGLLTARLEHPSIVPIHDLGFRPTGEPFYAMKLIDGRSFEKVIADCPTLAARIALLPHLIDACKAMAYAHSRGVIHRDLKPHNILVGAFGETVVIDWGLAKDLGQNLPEEPAQALYRENSSGELTGAGSILGTPAYMPPEQARGESVNARADVYSLGAILYHLLAGAPPFQGKNGQDTLQQVLKGQPAPLLRVVPEAPRELLSIATRAMDANPEKRHANAAELLADLSQFQQGKLVGSHSYSTRDLLRRWYQQHKTVTIMAASALTAIGLIVASSYSNLKQAHARTQFFMGEQVKAALDAREAQAQAQQAESEAKGALSSLLFEQGNRALLDGDPQRALLLLGRAYQAAPFASTALRFSLAEATRARPAFSQEGVLAAALLDQGARAILVRTDGTLQLRDTRSWASLATFGRSGGAIVQADFSRDRSRVLTWGQNTYHVWDTATGDRLSTGAAQRAHLSPDGTHLLAITEEGAELRETATGKPGAAIVLPGKDAKALFSPDSKQLLLFGAQGHRRYTLPEGKLVASSADSVQLAAFSPDSSTLATVDSERPNELLLTNSSGQTRASLRSPAQALFGTVDAWVVVEQDGAFESFDLKQGARLALSQGEPGTSAQAVGSFVFRAERAGLSAWDARSGLLLWSDPYRSGLVQDLAQDGVLLSLSGERLYAFDSAPLRLGGALRSFGTPHDISGDGVRVLSSTGPSVTLWSRETGRELLRFSGHSGEVTSAQFSPEGGHILSTSRDQSARLWDATSGELLATLRADTALRSAVFSPDGDRVVLVPASESEPASLWDTHRNSRLATLSAQNATGAPQFSQDGAVLLTFSDEKHGGARLWDGHSGEARAKLSARFDVVSAVFSPNGKEIVAAGKNEGRGELSRFDAISGTQQRSLARSEVAYNTLAASPDGQFVALAGQDGTISVRRADSGGLVFSLDTAGEPASALRYADKGALLVALSASGAVSLWDTSTGALLRADQAPGLAEKEQASLHAGGDWMLFSGGTPRLQVLAIERRNPEEVAAQHALGHAAPSKLSKEMVRRTIRVGAARILSCYERFLTPEMSFSGSVRMTFVIAPSGAVTQASARTSTLPAGVDACLVSTFSQLRFLAEEEPLEVSYPLVFVPARPDGEAPSEQPALLPDEPHAPLALRNLSFESDLFEGEVASPAPPQAEPRTPEEKRKAANQAASLAAYRGENERAIAIYRDLLVQYPEHEEAVSWQYEICLATLAESSYAEQSQLIGEVERLLSLYQTATTQALSPEMHQHNASLTSQLLKEAATRFHSEGQRLRDLRRLEQAEPLYRLFLENFPEQESAYNLRWNYSELLFSLDRWKDAGTQYRRVLEQDPAGKFAEGARRGIQEAERLLSLSAR